MTMFNSLLANNNATRNEEGFLVFRVIIILSTFDHPKGWLIFVLDPLEEYCYCMTLRDKIFH